MLWDVSVAVDVATARDRVRDAVTGGVTVACDGDAHSARQCM